MQIKKTEEGKSVLVLAVILFAICLSAYLYVLYSVEKGASVIAQKATMKGSVERERERALQFDIALRDNKAQINALNEVYIYENDTPKFIEKLEALAKTSGVQMRLSSMTSNLDKKDASLAVAVEVSGKYSNITRFIRSLELMPTYIIFNSLSYSLESKELMGQGGPDGLAVPALSKKATVNNPEIWSAKIGLSVLSYGVTPMGK